jgi:chitodextrinase
VPSGFHASSLSKPVRVALTWHPALDNVGVTGYRVYRDGTQIATTTGFSFTDTGRTPNTTYGYEVRAVDAATNLGAPATASATTPPNTDVSPPSPPPSLTATLGKGRRVDLRWTASTDPGGVTYRVKRNGTTVSTTTGLTLSDRPGRGSFTYVVEAYDAAGNTVSSNSISVTT